jgi:hypothetical protein
VAIFLNLAGIRSINILIAEAQLNAEQIVILGFSCNGTELQALEGKHPDDFQPG